MRKRKRRKNGGLAGHARTCVQFQCVKGRGKDFEGEGVCKRGYVLRCAEFADLPGLPRTVGTRKPYQEFTYGQGPRYRGARGRFAPKLPGQYLAPVDKWMRGLPAASVKSGKGVRRG